ncbi:MAG: zinc finger domain-containing protein [Candidatus Bathyarchaeia archaeon]
MSAAAATANEKIIRMPTCSWCARTILPGEGAVKFPCPSCGEVTIWRCEKCRMFGRPYRCVKCGYSAP